MSACCSRMSLKIYIDKLFVSQDLQKNIILAEELLRSLYSSSDKPVHWRCSQFLQQLQSKATENQNFCPLFCCMIHIEFFPLPRIHG